MAKSTKQDNKQSYTPEIADEICRRVIAGESLTSVCGDDHIPDTDTVMQWFMDDTEGFQERYLDVAAQVIEAVTSKVLASLPSPPLMKDIVARVLKDMGTENPEAIIDQLAAAGCLAD